MKRALVVGATGLVGASFLRQAGEVLPQWELHAVARRKLNADYAHVHSHIADSDAWPEIISDVKPDAVFSALGTTIKQAGSQAAFRAIDFELFESVGNAAKAAGTTHFIAISSTMADPDASQFYLKTKGDAERTLSQAGFARLDLIRPGLLRGNRGGSIRLGESLGIMLSPLTDALLHGSLRKYRSIHSDDVALAALNLLKQEQSGCFVHEHDAIKALASKA